jgi:O-methyltransferase involved in polyketide biosynthesis
MPTINGETLQGVSATALWTLHDRATEANRSDGVIRDPSAVRLFESIDYDYRKFGKPDQTHALRALVFDATARRYLADHPRPGWSRWPKACRPASGGLTRLELLTN